MIKEEESNTENERTKATLKKPLTNVNANLFYTAAQKNDHAFQILIADVVMLPQW